MTDVLLSLGTFLGGLGLFLLAVGMLTDGLRIAAGDALRDILARSTRTPLRGIASGVLVTAVVQSSSAVTVAIIGFVNAGLVTLAQALGVVYGANIGTTVTGWLVAAVGFDIDIEAFALPLIGVGMALRLRGAQTRLGASGEAMAGFGLFFIGVDVLKTAFEGAAATLDISSIAFEGPASLLLFLGIGLVMTMLTQSSSAAIAITLTAATGGIIATEPAAAMVIGANVGTTSTAALAAIGATSAARRVAAAHVVFNLVTGLAALLLLPVLLWGIGVAEDGFGLEHIPAVTLALFHTAFNLLGVVIMYPFTRPLARALEARFTSRAEALGRPRHLDSTLAGTPLLAVDALVLELTRLLEMVRGWTRAALSAETTDRRALDTQRDAILRLHGAVVDFVTQLERSRLPESVAERVPKVLRVLNYLDDVIELTTDALGDIAEVDRLRDSPVGAAIDDYRVRGLDLMSRCDPELPDFDGEELRTELDAMRDDWHQLKDLLLEAGASGHVGIRQVNLGIEVLRSERRMADQLIKAARRLSELGLTTPPPGVEDAAGGMHEITAAPETASADPPAADAASGETGAGER